MKHYTILVNGPDNRLAQGIANYPQKIPVTNGNFILWDNPAKETDINEMFNRLVPHCKGIDLYKGTGIGRLVRSEGSFPGRIIT